MKDVILTTERLILRPFKLGDEEGVLRFSSDPEVQEFTGDIVRTTYEEVHKVITDVWLKDYATYGYGRFAVIDKTTNEIIGFNGIKFLPEIGQPDLGYRFLKEYWGKGIATESSRAILNYSFDNFDLPEILGFVMLGNPASSAVLKKLGFQFKKLAPYPGEEENLEWYSLTPEHYERQ